VGLRKWGEALRALRAAEAHAYEFDDAHNQADAQAIRIRLNLARGHLAEAMQATAPMWTRVPGPVELREFEATCELARAVSEPAPTPSQLGPVAVSPTADTMTLELAAAAIRGLRHTQTPTRAITALRHHVMSSGCVDGFVIACRAYTPLLKEVVESNVTFGEYVKPVLQRSRDARLAKSAGLLIPRLEKAELTPREREVHELLAQGLTNREIAKLLYVEEVTVKVHVRHILDKLGVRSRVEAATKIS
jgi:DNA-binding NarL/FixJ family response regulator